jgi:hypothetical protein
LWFPGDNLFSLDGIKFRHNVGDVHVLGQLLDSRYDLVFQIWQGFSSTKQVD